MKPPPLLPAAPYSLGALLLIATLTLSLHAGAGAAPPAAPLLGWETLTRLDRLAEFKPPAEIGCVSSYDRTGGNDDGFSGKYSALRQEGDSLVIAELEGPGVIYRVWTPTPTDDPLEFYFDGEARPRVNVPFRELFLGRQAPFRAPLTGYGVGGFFCYVPLSYAKSCKVVLRGKQMQFIQINYARYAPGTAIETFDPATASAEPGRMEHALKLFGRAGEDLASAVSPPQSRLRRIPVHGSLAPGGSLVLLQQKRPGRIVGFRLSPAAAFGGKARDLTLRIAFDGQAPAVWCPLGDFFGYAWGEPAMRSLLIGTVESEAYCYFPMPFDRSATVEILSHRSTGPALTVDGEFVVSDAGRRTNEGRFQAVWRRENPTTPGQPFTFVDLEGRGHLVGFVLQAQGFTSGQTLFFEGDDETWIDGKLAVHGTGSEDFLNGGWYDVPDRWEQRLSFPLSGCLGYQKHLSRTGGYRFLLGDAYPFTRSVRQTIEHSGTGNDIPTDYAGVTYYYSEAAPRTNAPPSPTARAVKDLDEIVFAASWEIPIRAFPFENTTLTRRVVKVDQEQVRCLSVRGGAPDWVGPPYLFVTCHLPAPGLYEVSLDVVKGPDQGKVQLFQNEVPAGEPVDLYAESPTRARVVLGRRQLQGGDNPVMLKLVGKHEKATAVGLDLHQLVFQRTP